LNKTKIDTISSNTFIFCCICRATNSSNCKKVWMSSRRTFWWRSYSGWSWFVRFFYNTLACCCLLWCHSR